MPTVSPPEESARHSGTRGVRPREDALRDHRDPRGRRPRRHRGPRDAGHGAVGEGRPRGPRHGCPRAARLRGRRGPDVDPPCARGPPTRRHEPRQLHPGRSPASTPSGCCWRSTRRPPTTGTGTAASTCGHPTAPSPAWPARRSPSARHDRRPRRRPALCRRRRLPTCPATTRGSSSRAGGRSTCPSTPSARGSTTGCGRTSRPRAAGAGSTTGPRPSTSRCRTTRATRTCRSIRPSTCATSRSPAAF